MHTEAPKAHRTLWVPVNFFELLDEGAPGEVGAESIESAFTHTLAQFRIGSQLTHGIGELERTSGCCQESLPAVGYVFRLRTVGRAYLRTSASHIFDVCQSESLFRMRG